MRSEIKTIVGMLLFGVLLSACANAPSTPDEIKTLIGNPWVLLGVMYLGAVGSWLTTVATAKGSGSTIGYMEYLAHWETIVGAVLAVPIYWAGLVMLDQLNFAAAAAYGAIAQTSLDKLGKGGRTQTLMK